WSTAQRAGDPGPGQVWGKAPRSWGLAARGALVEAGGPDLTSADLDSRAAIWSDLAPKLYAQAAAAQWDPPTAIAWDATVELPAEVETAVVQVMTYLVENEQAALVVPARFLSHIHPHYREAAQFLAIQTADEARHVEVFTRRGLLVRNELGVSGAGGRASLQTLLEEPEFSVASFLLSVLGEGTFLHLLAFVERHAPDPVTARVCHLALQDEARHVAFGLGHLEEQAGQDLGLRDRLRRAVHRRHDALASTSGLNDDVFDALIVLAAGDWTPDAIGRGYDAVDRLQSEMDEGRQRRLVRLGFTAADATELSALHTRNFM
ncbi:MAG: ferritin-like domain-containing protein, partial [Actinomycetota bacterium]|nr:ferritin-like domain-containing protein [Actinomycetota bacterium]